MLEERFFRKPHFQLRDFGVSSPVASFSQNVSSSNIRHPVMAAGDEPWSSVFAVDSAAGDLDADSVTAAPFTVDSATGGFTGTAAGVVPAFASATGFGAATGDSGAFDAA